MSKAKYWSLFFRCKSRYLLKIIFFHQQFRIIFKIQIHNFNFNYIINQVGVLLESGKEDENLAVKKVAEV